MQLKLASNSWFSYCLGFISWFPYKVIRITGLGEKKDSEVE